MAECMAKTYTAGGVALALLLSLLAGFRLWAKRGMTKLFFLQFEVTSRMSAMLSYHVFMTIS